MDSVRAAAILQSVFAPLDVPIAFRLWDGTTVQAGADDAPVTVVFRSPRMFRRLLLHPTSRRFGEAFIAGNIDIEGDVFAATAVGNRLEQLRLPLGTRLALLGSLLRP